MPTLTWDFRGESPVFQLARKAPSLPAGEVLTAPGILQWYKLLKCSLMVKQNGIAVK